MKPESKPDSLHLPNMKNRIECPLLVIHFSLPGGSTVSRLLSDSGAFSFDRSARQLADSYEQALQQERVDHHDYSYFIYDVPDTRYEIGQLQIPLPNTGAGTVKVPYVQLPTSNDRWRGIVPHLEIDLSADTPEELEKRIREVLTLLLQRSRIADDLTDLIQFMALDRLTVEEVPARLTLRSRSSGPPPEQLFPYLKKSARIVERSDSEYFASALTARVGALLSDEVPQSVLLIGPRGCGKSELVRSLQNRWTTSKENRQLWTTTAAQLLIGLSEPFSNWRNNLPELVRELGEGKTVRILHVQSLQALFVTGKASGLDTTLGNELRRYIHEGKVRLVTETTPEELTALEDRYGELQTLFRTVELREPNPEELLQLVEKRLEKQDNMLFDPAAILTLIQLQQRFLTHAGYPGTTVRFLERMIRRRNQPDLLIGPEQIREQFIQETALPAWVIDPDITLDENRLTTRMNAEVFGQEEAVRAVVEGVKRIKTNLADPGRPIMNFFLVGPTGVGKTELARQLARVMFDDPERMIRIDLSEYQTEFDVTRLYQTETGGVLTDAVRAQPFSVILFDEIEKAHYDFRYLLLQILDSGRLTDGRQRTVSFGGTVIVMTSNIGAGSADRRPVGFREQSTDETAENYLRELRQSFPPEIIGRFDEVVVFRPLDPVAVRRVVDRELEYLKTWPGLADRTGTVEVSPEARELLALRGYDRAMGARQLQRTLRDLLLIPLSRVLLQAESLMGTEPYQIKIDRQEDQLSFELELPDSDDFGMLAELGRQTDLKFLEDIRLELDRYVHGWVGRDLQEILDALHWLRSHHPDVFAGTPHLANAATQLTKLQQELIRMQEEVSALEKTLAFDQLHLEDTPPNYQEQLEQLQHRRLNWRFDLYQVASGTEEAPHAVSLAIYGRGAELVLRFLAEWFRHEGWSTPVQRVLLLPGHLDRNENSKGDILDNLSVLEYTDETELIGLGDAQGGQFVAGAELLVRGPFCRMQLELFVGHLAQGQMKYYSQPRQAQYVVSLVVAEEEFLRENPERKYFGQIELPKRAPELRERTNGQYSFSRFGSMEEGPDKFAELVSRLAEFQNEQLMNFITGNDSWIGDKLAALRMLIQEAISDIKVREN